MKLRNPRFFFLILWAVFSTSGFGQGTSNSIGPALPESSAAVAKGVVVETIKSGSASQQAGLQVGDVLLHWTRGDAKGELESPFDLSWVEIEQAPRGPVTIEGQSGTELRAWVVEPGIWGVDARPRFSEALLAVYLEGQKLAAAGVMQGAAARWRSTARNAQEFKSPWFGTWLLFHSAESLANAQQWKDADAAYAEAIEHGTTAGPVIKAQVLRAQARTFERRADWISAEKYHQAAMEENKKLSSENLMVAATLDSLSFVAWSRRDLDRCETYNSEALKIQQRLAPGSLSLSKSLNGLGLVAWRRGDLAKAEIYIGQALAIQERLAPGSPSVATVLNNLGIITRERGDLAKAEDYHLRALAIQKGIDSGSLDTAQSLNNLAMVFGDRGDLAKAEENLRQALAINEKLAPEKLPFNLGNLGSVALERGDLVKAEDYHRRALAIREKLFPDSLDVASSLGDLGIVAQERGDLAKAEDYQRRALTILQKLAPASLEVASALNNLGNLARDRGDMNKAEKYYSQALASRQEQSPASIYVAEILSNLGTVARSRGDLAKAEDYYRQGLAIWGTLAPEKKEYAETLAALAGIMVRKQQLDAAAPLFEQALKVLDSQMSHLGGTQETRSGFRAHHVDTYREYIDLLVRHKQPEIAFQVVERSRARTLLEMLAEAHIDTRRGVDVGLLEQERSLRSDVNAKVDRRIRLQGSPHTEERVAEVNKEIESLLAQYNDVEEQIRASSPSYAALTRPVSLSAKEIQQLLDDDTLLLEYSLGEERSYVWAVAPGSLASYELPKRADVEGASRRVYELLTPQNRRINGETEPQRQARLVKAEAEYPKAAAALSRMLLGPMAAEIRGKRLLIVGDGALHYLPFAVLPEPAALNEGQASKPKGLVPLVVEHEVVSLPSASVLALLRQQRIGRKEAAKAVAVLADPVFDPEDVRVARATMPGKPGNGRTGRPEEREDKEKPASWSSDRLTRSVADVGLRTDDGGSLARLRFTRHEARAIMAVTPRGAGLTALDFQASRETATSPRLAQYRIVHFATHGLLDNEHPELSGLVLSLVNEQGRRKNGFLDLEDIYNLNLPAELVVLSACETGLGKDIQGEGLIGLTRGFMYAGASRVVASLWNVDDVATAELMGRFYKAMEQDGLRPAAALRRAQIEMWKHRDWNAPYYWAAFQMQGEWK